jgi:hypothetical protein
MVDPATMSESEAVKPAETENLKTTSSRGEMKCSQEGCKRPYKAKGLCIAHYRKWRHGELPKGRYKICTKEACLKPRAPGNGSFCVEHKGVAAAAT